MTTTTPANPLQAHIQRVNQHNPTEFLGRLVWYTVSESLVSHDDMVKGLTQVGLASQLPLTPKDYDVFRRVSSDAKQSKVATHLDGVFENYLIREVAGKGEDVIVKRVVCEQVNRSAKKLDYNAELMDIEFDRNTSAISVKYLLPWGPQDPNVVRQRGVCQAIEKYIRTEFAAQKGKLNAYAIREFIRKMLLRQFAATLVREGGGVYFVTEDQAKNVNALEAFVNQIPGADFHSLPLLDDIKQRQMVKKAFEAETIGEIDQMMAEIQEIKSAGTSLSSDRYARMLTRYQELTAKTKNYGGVLEEQLGECHSRLSLFQTSIIQLTAQVRS